MIAALAAGKSYDAVAHLTGISKATVGRRMRQPAFRRKVRMARRLILDRAVSLLAQGAIEAVIVLRRLLLRSASEKIKLGAARAILQAEHQFHETEDLSAEIEELREQIAQLLKKEKRR